MIDPRYSVLHSLFADRVFRIPHYQRFYSWYTRQREDLFSDLTKLATRVPDQHHFMATLVCHRTSETKSIGADEYRVYDIVDGQQRMTTLIILLKCIELVMPAESEDRKDLQKTLVKRDGNLILLQTNNANERIFNRFIREGTGPQEADIETHSDRNLSDAIDECSQFVTQWQKGNELTALLKLVKTRLAFVVYDTEDSRVVYTVFEVLNSRGLSVDWLDKTKSVLMGRAYELASSTAAAEAGIQSLQSIWGQIYREIAKESVPGDEILRVMATLYYGPSSGKPQPADNSLELLRKDCDKPDKPRRISECLLDVARKLVVLQGNVFLGPVTEILHARLLSVAIMSAKSVNEEERKSLLSQWERVSFRIYSLYGKDSRYQVGDYVRLAAKIVSEDADTRTCDQIMTRLRLLGSGYPIDGAVDAGLVQKDCYEESPEMCRYILWRYEEYRAQSLGTGATVDEIERARIWRQRAADSIEHIFPQTPGVGWNGKMRRKGGHEQPVIQHVGRIGNLMLLPIVLNKQAKARPFHEKKEFYMRHNLRMIQEVCNEDDWTLEKIEARENCIANWAKTAWCDL